MQIIQMRLWALGASAIFGFMSLTTSTSAQVNITVDTAVELTGNFSLQGLAADTVSPVTFSFLPGGVPQGLDLMRDTTFGEVSIFPEGFADDGDDPSFAKLITDSLQNFDPVSGSYIQDGQTVSFSYTNLVDTGGGSGDFSGNFRFTIPEPGTALLMIAGGLLVAPRARRC